MKHGTIVPLIGGLSVAASKVTKTDPAFFLSYSVFRENERNVTNYFSNTPRYELDSPDRGGFNLSEHQDVDFIQALCPCAGLSLLSSGDQDHRDKMNYWMLESARFVAEEVRPKVFWGENASALYTNSGKRVRDQLRATAERNGYSFSIYHTNTMYHGIPQNRKRSFYFFWRDSSAPIFEYYRREMKPLTEYLSGVSSGIEHHTLDDLKEAQDFLMNHPHIKFLQEKFSGNGVSKIREWLNSRDVPGTTVLTYLQSTDQLREVADWCFKHGYDKEGRDAERVLRKKEAGGNFWDGSFPIYKDVYSTLIDRTYFGIHPTEDRVLTIREGMHLMGLPEDFSLVTGAKNHVCQNVPVTTASDMTREVVKFINGESNLSNSSYLLQSNLTQRIDVQESRLLEF